LDDLDKKEEGAKGARPNPLLHTDKEDLLISGPTNIGGREPNEVWIIQVRLAYTVETLMQFLEIDGLTNVYVSLEQALDLQERIISFFRTTVSTISPSSQPDKNLLQHITAVLQESKILTLAQTLVDVEVSANFDVDECVECAECDIGVYGDANAMSTGLGGNGIHLFPTTRKKRKPNKKRKTKGGKKHGKNKTKKQRKNKKNTKTRRRK
jgi:hypothetical protein